MINLCALCEMQERMNIMPSIKNFNNQNSKIQMFDYQRAVQIKSGRDTLICNWTRGLGKTFTIMSLMIEQKPKDVLYFKSENDYLKTLKDKYNELIYCFPDIKNSIKNIVMKNDKLEITYNNGEKTFIYNWYTLPLGHGIKKFDYLIFDGLLPSSLKYINAERTISFVTTNNYNHHLEKLFSNKTVNILNEDYKTGINCGIFTDSFIDNIKQNISIEDWYEQYDLLNNPNIENKQLNINVCANRKYDLYKSYAIENPSKKFLIDSLVGLEEEYDRTDKTKDTVLTRKNLLDMIIQLQREIGR